VTGNGDDCMACDLAAGRLDLPGGQIAATDRWIVEHCVGPLGVGSLIVKPARHVVSVGELDAEEADELGSVLRRAAAVVDALVQPEQVYVGLWSHAGRRRVHIHFVVQPATTDAIERAGDYGPGLPAAQFELDEKPPRAEVETFCENARRIFWT
jgi:diadenosine tetraphosphate (Ap4A) HIT family hydrolase